MTSARPADLAGPSALDQVAQRALERLAAVPDVLRAGFAVAEGGRRQLLFTATDRGDDTGSFEWCRIDPAWQVPLNRAARDGALVAGTLEELEARFPAFVADQRDTPFRFVASVPVTHEDELLGGFVVYSGRRQPADERLREELLRLGRLIGADLVDARRGRRRQPAGKDQTTDGTRRASHDMPGETTAVRAARGFLHTTLEDWGVERAVVQDAVLCLDELVTNALVHTHGGCRVTVTLDEHALRVRVVDHGGLGPIRLAPTVGETAAHGRGLQIVEAVANRSGRDATECLAWFEIDVPAATRRGRV